MAALTASAVAMTTNTFFMIDSFLSRPNCRNLRGINILARHHALAQLVEQVSGLLQYRRWSGLFGLNCEAQDRRGQQREVFAALDQLQEQAWVNLGVLPELQHDGGSVALDAFDADALGLDPRARVRGARFIKEVTGP
jgi:hypothetical protein